MRTRRRFQTILPIAAIAAVLSTAACGDSGSSGTGGGAGDNGSASGEACAAVAGDKLVVLEDDKGLQNADNIVPAVNAAASSTNPALLEALNTVSAKLTEDDLIGMNKAVDIDRKSATDVAAAYVSDNKLGEDVSGGSGPVIVGAADFSESQVLANVYADTLKAAGFDATVQTVGNRELYLPALERGEIQAFPEYLATVTAGREGRARLRRPRRGDRPERLRRHQGVRRQPRRLHAVRAGRRLRRWIADPRWAGGVPDPPAVPAGPGGDLRAEVRQLRRVRRRRPADQGRHPAGRRLDRAGLQLRRRPRSVEGQGRGRP